jgi:hypothetical protein
MLNVAARRVLNAIGRLWANALTTEWLQGLNKSEEYSQELGYDTTIVSEKYYASNSGSNPSVCQNDSPPCRLPELIASSAHSSRSWRSTHHFPPKHLYLSTRAHGVTTTNRKFAAVNISNLQLPLPYPTHYTLLAKLSQCLQQSGLLKSPYLCLLKCSDATW